MGTENHTCGMSEIEVEPITQRLARESRVHWNVAQEVITITEDKLKLCLSQYLKRAEKKRGWATPLGILLPIVLTLVTTTFKDFGLDAATWRAMFIIGGLLTFFWLVKSLSDALRALDMNDLVRQLKAEHPSSITTASEIESTSEGQEQSSTLDPLR